MNAIYIKKSTLEWSNLWNDLGMKKDNGGRWYTSNNTPAWVVEYLKGFRTPSRSWPNSYSKALLTQKFAKIMVEKDPKLAVLCGVAEES